MEARLKELVESLTKYKIRSKVDIEDLSSNFIVGVINFENFKIIQKSSVNKKQPSNLETVQFLSILGIMI